LKSLAAANQPIRETDVRSLHSLLIGDQPNYSPGEYRNIGVLISGSEYRPPEPIDVAWRMEDLIDWLSENLERDPIQTAAVAHHELAAIHPFKDGNGRVSRLVMNLILLRHGYPICNIRREDRPKYYDALSFADVGLYEPLVNLILDSCAGLFAEYVRIRTETKRMADWAERWGTKETEILVRRESREMELWLSRIRQVFLEFQKATELLNDKLENIELSFYDYKTELSFDRYQHLLEAGWVEYGNAFSITFLEKKNGRNERFMFRYYRNREKFSKGSRLIPLELNYFDRESNSYVRLCEVDWATPIRIRELYFTPEKGEFVVRYYNIDKKQETEKKGCTISEAVQWFYDDILRNIFQLS
jgi:fido (protein-threonine AMPylation protein)